MGNSKRDVLAFIVVITIIAVCTFSMAKSYMKDRESRGKTDPINLKTESPVKTFELPDDTFETFKRRAEELKEGLLNEQK